MMKNCKKIEPLLSEYIDGTLSNELAWSVQLHLGACESCSKVAQEFKATVGALQSATRPQLSASFDASLAARIADIDSRTRRSNAFVNALRAWSASMTHRQRMRLAISTPVLAATFAVMLTFLAPHPTSTRMSVAPIDPGFAATCVQQHRTFVASQPLADPSAQALAQHMDSTSSEGVNALNMDGSL